MKKLLNSFVILSITVSMALTGIYCSKTDYMEGDFRLSEGNYASKTLIIKKVDDTKYSVRYLDELSRGNKPQMLDATKDGNKLIVQMRSRQITFIFSENDDSFSFKQYGRDFKFERKITD